MPLIILMIGRLHDTYLGALGIVVSCDLVLAVGQPLGIEPAGQAYDSILGDGIAQKARSSHDSKASVAYSVQFLALESVMVFLWSGSASLGAGCMYAVQG